MDEKPFVDYDAIAAAYAANRSASPRVVAHLVERLSGQVASSLLEIGCGTADYLAALAGRLDAAGFGFDASARMLDQAHRKNPGFTLKQGDACGRFPFDDNSFDITFSVNLVHYLSNLQSLFSEAYRVTRPGGRVVTVTQCADDLRQRTISRYFPESVAIELARYPAIEEICSAMHTAGYRAVEETRTVRTFAADETELAHFQDKAFSALRLIPRPCFEAGMAKLAAEFAAGQVLVREAYTYLWGTKAP